MAAFFARKQIVKQLIFIFRLYFVVRQSQIFGVSILIFTIINNLLYGWFVVRFL